MLSQQKGKGQLDACENIQESVSSILALRNYLTSEEETEIHRQFRSSSWKPNHQVLWSGMLRDQAQTWADKHCMQTLTTAMGPLMDPSTSSCLQKKKSNQAWSRYIHGASAVFAWHIAKNDRVTVLCPPPPQRFHPSGLSYYQTIEEPILRAAIAEGATLRIDLIHPGVKGAEDFRYQLWPLDETETWIAAHGTGLCYKCAWRMVKGDSSPVPTKKAMKPQTSAPTPKTSKTHKTEEVSATASTSTIESKISPKKSKKKKKTTQKKEAACVTKLNAADPSSSTTKSKAKALKKGTPSALATAGSRVMPMPTDNKTLLSKKDRRALKALEARLMVDMASKTTKAKTNDLVTVKNSSQAKTPSTAKTTSGMAKAEKKRAKKALRAATRLAKKEKKKKEKKKKKAMPKN